MPAAEVSDKPIKSRDHIGPLVSYLIELHKNNKSGDGPLFSRLMRDMIHSTSISITDRYASVHAYLHVFSKSTSYKEFLKIIESDSFDEDSKLRELTLLYGALISSGCVFTWSDDVQMAVIRRLLHLAKSLDINSGLAFEFFDMYISHIKIIKFNTGEIIPPKLEEGASPQYLHMLFMMERIATTKSNHMEKMLTKSLDNLSLMLLNGSDYKFFYQLCLGVVSGLYNDSDNLVMLWEKMLALFNARNKRKPLALVIFLASVLDYTTKEDCNTLLPRFFSLGSGKLFSSCVDGCPKYILNSFSTGFKHLKDEVKVVLIKSIVSETEKLREKALGRRAVDNLKTDLNFESIQELCKFYQYIINGSLKRTLLVKDDIKEEEFSFFDKNLYVAAFGKLLSHPNCLNEVTWRGKCWKYLFNLGFTKDNDVLPEVADTAKKVFFSCMNHRFPRLVDLINSLDKIVLVAGKKIPKKELNVPISSQVHSAWKLGQKCLGQLLDGEVDEELAVILQLLLLYMMLLLFKDQTTARDAIGEIDSVIKNVHNNDKGIHWTEVLVDLFLQLLSMWGHSHRNIISCVFGHVSTHMTPKALNQILNVISDDVEDDDEEDMDVTMEEGDDEESAKEVDEEKAKDSHDDSESDENSDESSGSEEFEETANDKLRNALREQLYQIDTASTAGSVNLDDLDEEEGRQLNNALGQIFKQHSRVPISKEEKKMKIHFKNRAIVLLEILLDHNPPVEFILKIISRLVGVLKLTLSDKESHDLSSSIKRALSKCCSLRKFNISLENPIASDDIERCLLDCIKSDCSISIFQDVCVSIKDIVLLLIRIALANSLDIAPIINILQGVLDSFFTQNDSIYPHHFIVSLLSSQSTSLIPLMPPIVYFAFSPTVKSLKRTVAMELLVIFFKDSRNFQKTEKVDWDSIDVGTVKLIKKIKKLIKQIAENETELNANYGIAFFELLIIVNNRSQHLGLDPKELKAALKASVEKFPAFTGKLRKVFLKCNQAFGLPKITKTSSESEMSSKKRSTSDSESPVVNGSPKRKKKENTKNSSP